jgi:tetratricopeptide (TPR) repeat protein
MNVEELLPAFQSRLRAFAFGPELDSLAASLLKILEPHRRRRADINDRLGLKALALAAEYLDATGRAPLAASLLRLTVDELIDDSPCWPAQLASATDPGSTRRLLRQRVWCALAFAHSLLRAHRLPQAGLIIEKMAQFVHGHLASPEFPCHGTLALIHYYRGLWRRDIGQLRLAAWDFDAALDLLQLRLAAKQVKFESVDPDRLRRELIYSRVSSARILGFGHGGVALSRGRLIEARGWLLASQQILAQLGQEMWRRGLDVYLRSASVLLLPLSPSSQPALQAHTLRLAELAEWFATRNPRHAALAEAFSLIADVRLRQIPDPLLPLDLSGLRRRLERSLRSAAIDGGPLSAAAALQLTDCLLRAQDWSRCEAELDRFQSLFPDPDDAPGDFAILRAELFAETGRLPAARAVLELLLDLRPANRSSRARAWALLARCELRAGQLLWAHQAAAAARLALEDAQDGFVRAWVAAQITPIRPALPPAHLPFQNPDEGGRWCDLDHNLEAARLHVVESVYRRFPGHSVEKLAALLGRGPSWLYAFLARHRDSPWVVDLLSR